MKNIKDWNWKRIFATIAKIATAIGAFLAGKYV